MAGRVHCSAVTRAVLEANDKASFSLEERGLVDMKGKGKLTTYWLEGTEYNVSLNKAALANLDDEIKDLLLKADFDMNIGSMEEGEAALCQDKESNSEEVKQPPKPKREFCLPKKTSVVRCSVPSMHDVRRIGSIMRRIKNGGDGPAKNFSWGKKNRMAPRQVKSTGDADPPAKRPISKLSDETAHTVAKRLSPINFPQKFRKLNEPGKKVSSDAVPDQSIQNQTTMKKPLLGFPKPTSAGRQTSATVSDLSLRTLTTRAPVPEVPGDISYTKDAGISGSAKLSDDGLSECSISITGARRISSYSSDTKSQ